MDIAVIETTRAVGSGSRARGLKRSDFLMPEILMEKINHPITFEMDSLHAEDPDDDIWPTPQRMPERGVVLLNAPRSEPVVPASPPGQWTEATIHQTIRICRERGFVPGAIVASRPLLGSGLDWKVKSFVYWGVIVSLHTYIPGQVYDSYAPSGVRWFVPSNHNNRTEDRLFPGDLYLLHAAMTEETITNKMKQQQDDWS